MVIDRYAGAHVCAPGSFPDLVRHDSFHDANAGESLAALARGGERIDEGLVDWRNRVSILLSDLRRLLWRRQRHSDAGGDGTPRFA